MSKTSSSFFKGFMFIVFLAAVGFAGWKIVSSKVRNPSESMREKYHLTCDRIATITVALDEAFEEATMVPDATLAVHLKDLVDRYASDVIYKDAWGNDLLFQFGDGAEFYVASAGSDGRFAGFDNQGFYSSLPGQDIIARRGAWKLAPDDVQWGTTPAH